MYIYRYKIIFNTSLSVLTGKRILFYCGQNLNNTEVGRKNKFDYKAVLPRYTFYTYPVHSYHLDSTFL